MSDPVLDELAEAARNRGLKLVRSRVRTPSKRRFGKVGLTDTSGKAVFGMDAKGPIGKLEDVQDYLRNLDAKDWGASLDVAVLPRKRRPKKPARKPANENRDPGPEPAPERAPPPSLPEVRDARPSDAPRLAELIRTLGYEIGEKQVRKNLAALRKSDEAPLVAMLDRKVVGLCGISRRVVLARAAPLGRISTLVVAEEARGKGIGRMLVRAAEEWMLRQGCDMVEVTSSDRRAEAHAFYRHIGYERTGMRFAKAL